MGQRKSKRNNRNNKGCIQFKRNNRNETKTLCERREYFRGIDSKAFFGGAEGVKPPVVRERAQSGNGGWGSVKKGRLFSFCQYNPHPLPMLALTQCRRPNCTGFCFVI